VGIRFGQSSAYRPEVDIGCNQIEPYDPDLWFRVNARSNDLTAGLVPEGEQPVMAWFVFDRRMEIRSLRSRTVRFLPGRAVYLLAVLLCSFFPRAGASPLFEDSAVVEFEFTGPFSALVAERESPAGEAFLIRASGIEHRVKVRKRGKSRQRVCDFPPLQINFAGDREAGTIFEGQNKLKLVTHCKKNQAYESYVLKEYAAYRIFNAISDVGYKVRLARIRYIDSDRRLENGTIEKYGFLIESAAELANRTGGRIVRAGGVSLSSLDAQHAASVFIFQFLIGNTDWSLVTAEHDDTCCHNGDLFEIGARRYYVPFDFDLAGLVNARYARPDPSLRMSRVTQRRYRGYCIPSDSLFSALSAIKLRKGEIMEALDDVPGLSREDIDAGSKYIEKFFVAATDEEKLIRKFERTCL
jgi:hypothetical protein